MTLLVVIVCVSIVGDEAKT